jgi:hypothetical protein
MAVVGLLILLAAGKLLFPAQAEAWHIRLRRLLTETADTLHFLETLGRSLRSPDREGVQIEVFYPATDVIEGQPARLPSYPPL